MTNKRWLRLSTVLLSTTLFACGSNDDTPAPKTFREFAVAVGETMCAQAFGCCSDTERATFFGSSASEIPDEPTCVEVFTQAADYGNYDTSIAAGKIVFDAGAAKRCASPIHTRARS